MQEDFVFEKYEYIRRKNIIIAHKGLLFLLERRFESLMSVVLIRAGMVITNSECWKERKHYKNNGIASELKKKAQEKKMQ